MKILRLEVPPPQHDALFVTHYPRPLAYALQLCDGNRALAEDLVQDSFIRFVTHRPDLETIEHLDAYLRTILRHIHLSRVRRAARQPALPISLVDFDSANLGLRAYDGRSALQVRDELRALCRYGCERCTTSKTGSVFLLRFLPRVRAQRDRHANGKHDARRQGADCVRPSSAVCSASAPQL